MNRRPTALGLFATLAACAGEKADVTDDFTEMASLDPKSDAFSARWKIVGSLDYGQQSGATKYSHPARYRAFKFAGTSGEKITVDVNSQNGDTVAWILDDDFKTIGANDDINRHDTDSRIDLTLPAHPSATHYIVVREYSLQAMTFTVTLKGKKKPDLYTCKADADCARVEKGCCPLGNYTAVRQDQADAWRASLGCADPMVCPKILTREDHSMAECLAGKCTLVALTDIACGGHSANPHHCPADFLCEGKQLQVDGPGKCSQQCAGKQSLQCNIPGQFCVDNPNDDCNPAGGGADCIGSCRDAICSGKTAKCALGFRWNQFECSCVENTSCGGFANFPCAAGKACVDNPSDNCDPQHGGADCPGVCAAATDCRVKGCAQGSKCSPCWGPSNWVCLPNGALC